MIVASFYHFFDFPDFAAYRAELLTLLKKHGMRGTILLAPEGINGTIAGSREAVDNALAMLRKIAQSDFFHRESPCDHLPFGRAKVRLKKEIISLGKNISPKGAKGTHLNAEQWNALINDPEVTVLDARNRYEVHLGTFERAVDPNIKNFKQLPNFVEKNLDPARHKKIATFCTGGIRCEKFAAWLIEQGFEEVYQLKGGILSYLENVPESESRWEGECYVFDERVAVGHALAPSREASMCRACGHALTSEDRAHELYRKDLACPHCTQYGSAMRTQNGFTLLELSIVLVIIGLIVGTILVGNDMIQSSRAQAQVTQFQQLVSGTQAFEAKYGVLPGDMLPADAVSYGMATRNGAVGRGNGDHRLDTTSGATSSTNFGGESALFWNDLGQSKFLGGDYSLGIDAMIQIPVGDQDKYLPAAAIGKGHIAVYSYAVAGGLCYGSPFCFTAATIASTNAAGLYTTSAAVTPTQGFAMDGKADDGFPLTGKIRGGGPSGVTIDTTNATCLEIAAGVVTRYNVKNNPNSLACAVTFYYQTASQ